jgi:ABC-2 type transport system ATP-binding protein
MKDKQSDRLNIPALDCQKVVKQFRRGRGFKKKVIRALDGATLTVPQGELFGLLGPNGAGKTTLVRCIATLLIPDQGTIRIFGNDVFQDSLFCRQRIGLLTSGERTLYWKLSARDNLKFFAALYGLTGSSVTGGLIIYWIYWACARSPTNGWNVILRV